MIQHMLMTVSQQLCYLLPCVFLIGYFLFKQNNQRSSKNILFHSLGIILFCWIVLAIFRATGIPSLQYVRFDPNINIIPFVDIFSNTNQYILNIILCIPLGFLLPFLWGKYEKPLYILMWGLFFSLAIELGQLFNYRATDIDDLLMNTLGALIGGAVCLCVYKLFPRLKELFHLSEGKRPLSKYEPFLYIFLCFLVVFLGL